MTANGWLQIAFFFALVLAVTKPLGVFMTRVFQRERLVAGLLQRLGLTLPEQSRIVENAVANVAEKTGVEGAPPANPQCGSANCGRPDCRWQPVRFKRRCAYRS